MKTKQTRGTVYLSLVSVLLMAAPAAVFANEQDCLSLINQTSAQNTDAILDDTLFMSTKALSLNEDTISRIFAEAPTKCGDLPNGAVVVGDLDAAASELGIAADFNESGDTILASEHELNAAPFFALASTDALLGFVAH